MYPTNHYMDPYSSYYRHHAPYPYYPPPGWEAGHKQMPEADSSCRPPYGPWPYSASMNHSGHPESHSHSCCSHTYPPGYYSFRPPFPQELPPPPPALYYHGPFPPHHHPNPYSSSPYFGPLPPYPVDQTPYNGYYDKFPKSHCCGCPNHVCHGDGGQRSSVKIEEHNMPAEVKDDSRQKVADDNSSIIRNPNYQYPVMWLPPGDMKDNKGSGRSFEFPPQFFSKWFPQSVERTEDVKPADDSQKAKQLQWPMVWMPAGYGETKPEAKKELKEIEQSPKKTQEDPPSPKIKIIPLSWFGNDSRDQKPAARDGSGEQNGRSSVANPAAGTEHQHDTTGDGNCKTIPVVPEKPNSGKEPATSAVLQKANSGNKPAISVVPKKPNSGNEPAISVVPEKQDVEKKVRTCRTIPVMPQKENDEKKSHMDGNKEENKAIEVRKEGENKKSGNVESSKPKPSKLPPVCLRVDPLPKKKSGNTSSRSSNQATKKVCEKEKDVKEAQAKNQEPKISDHKKEDNGPVKEKSSDEIAKKTGPRNVTVLDASVKNAQEEQVLKSMTDQKVEPTVSAGAQENVSARSLQECDKNRKEDELKIQGEASNLSREIKLSEPDAAVRIQSAYRGYHVRRWQPLEKLRKIKNVHKQMQDVEKQLQALESSSKQPTEKEQIAINETIMNLLLNLDTIQNLHPVVREARKSVARQLVCLQEKLDSLCKKLPAEPSHPKSEEASLTGVDEGQLPSSVNSKSEEASLTGVDEEQLPMHDEVSSEVSLKLSQDGACTEPNHPKSEEASLTGVDEGQLASLVNSNEPMHDEVSSEVSLKLSQDGACCTEQTHQMEESSTANEEAQDEGKAAAAVECEGVPPTDVMHDAALSGHITEKHQMEEPDILREESAEEEKAAAKSEGLSTHYLDGSVSKQCSEGSAERNWNTQESNQRVSPTTTEDGTTAVAAASTDSEMAADNDGSAEGGQVQESASIGISCLKHDDAPAEDRCKEASAPSLHLEDSSVPPKAADPHENDPGLADDSVITNPGDQQEESVVDDMQKEVADTVVDSDKDPNGTTTPPVGDTNSENTEQETIVLVGSETAKQCEVSGKVDSTLVDQQNELAVEDPAGGSAIAKETEAVPSDVEGKPMENSPNDALGEVPEAVPVESEDKTMEHSLNDAIGQEPEAIAALESRADAIVEESEAVALEIDGKSTENTLDDVIGEEPEAAPLENMENTLNVAIGEEPEAVPLESRDETIEKTLKDAPGEEPEAAVPVETDGKTMENTLNDAIGEEPEAAPLENRGNTMEDTLDDSGSVSNTSPEPALPDSIGDGSPSEHDGGGALYGDNPDSNFSLKSQGDLVQKEEHDDGGKLAASEATEAGKLEEGPAPGAPPEEAVAAAAAMAPATRDDGPKGDGDDDKNMGLSEENQKLKEMLQKLLASGNRQMGVIEELSDKVKSLERKLARKRRPKVRVQQQQQHRQARNATANDVVH